MKPYKGGPEKRFWAKVNKTDSCWLWTANTSPDGYGNFVFRKKQWKAHRASYTMFVGEIDPGMFVLHSCDNPGCVRPKHLRQGTHQDNMNDRSRRGRTSRGVGRHFSILTEEEVRAIREEYALGGTSHRKLGRKYGVDGRTVGFVLRRQTWKHVQ